MNKTAIGWTDYTWNTTSGCTKVSPGCEHCYAEAISLRFGRSQHPWTKPYEAENVKLHPERLMQPFKLKGPARVFVDSMSDLFHELVPQVHIAKVFAVMEATPEITYQILTKRPERMHRLLTSPGFQSDVEASAELLGLDLSWSGHWPLPNVWLGTSTEDQRRADERIPWLVSTPAAVRFLSCEPLLGEVDLTDLTVIAAKPPYGPRVGFDCLTGYYHGPDEIHPDERVHWVIAGGESGPNFRPMDMDWARSLRDQCQAAGVAFWFKQSSGRLPERGRELDGQRWEEFPGSPIPKAGERTARDLVNA